MSHSLPAGSAIDCRLNPYRSRALPGCEGDINRANPGRVDWLGQQRRRFPRTGQGSKSHESDQCGIPGGSGQGEGWVAVGNEKERVSLDT
jgi:hypothetical protein